MIEITVCKNGHPFDVANTYYRKDRRGRQCRKCQAECNRTYRESLKQYDLRQAQKAQRLAEERAGL